MRSVRLFVTAVALALSLGAVMVPAGIQGSGHPMAGIQGTGSIVAAPSAAR
ncbi:MAG TPA: hypothetical protein VL652_34285 [Kutzneria sp.]|jgi:hypothetical protein|nr:hypothetical protein [Kutzneria sp.]